MGLDPSALSASEPARRRNWLGLRRRPRGHGRHEDLRSRRAKTLIAAQRRERIDAPMMIDGAPDEASFLAYVEQFAKTIGLHLRPLGVTCP